MLFSTISLLVAHKQLQYTARFSRQDNPQEFLVATNARQEIRTIFAKNKAYFCKNRPYFLTGRWAAALANILLKTFCVPPSVAQYSSLAERQRTSPNKAHLQGNCRPNFWVGIWSFHTTIIGLNMFISPVNSTILEAACASQRLHTRSCGPAMCLRGSLFPAISRLRVQPVAIAFTRNARLSFRCHVCSQVAIGFAARAFFPDMDWPAFCCHQCCRYLCPRHFFPSMLP